MMGDVVKFPSALIDDHGFIVDMARFADGLLTQAQIKKKYRFDAATWEKLGSDDALVEKIEEEKARRIRDGSTKRERAQVEVIDAGPILGKIMRDPNANEKHRIDSIKTLDQLAATGPESVPAADRFIISINISGDGSNTDVLHFNKSRTIDPNDVDPNEQELIPFASFKGEDGGNGEPL
jgi:hypothetical protein